MQDSTLMTIAVVHIATMLVARRRLKGIGYGGKRDTHEPVRYIIIVKFSRRERYTHRLRTVKLSFGLHKWRCRVVYGWILVDGFRHIGTGRFGCNEWATVLLLEEYISFGLPQGIFGQISGHSERMTAR
jgi:hypothetical protein